jgi:hypothetical protein
MTEASAPRRRVVRLALRLGVVMLESGAQTVGLFVPALGTYWGLLDRCADLRL